MTGDKKILIVDDDEDVLLTISKILKKEDYDIITKNNAMECMNYLHDSNRPDLILMDINLPLIDGWRACKMIKEDPELNSIPVVILTQSNNPDDIQKSKLVGSSGHLNKTLPSREFLIQIEDFFLAPEKNISCH